MAARDEGDNKELIIELQARLIDELDVEYDKINGIMDIKTTNGDTNASSISKNGTVTTV